jgi:membrane protein required for colicin V production
MSGFDYAVVAILALSVIFGWWRGLVYEVLSLAGWVVALVVSRMFAEDLAQLLPLSQQYLNLIVSYALLFVLTLIASGIVAWLVSKLVKLVGLRWLDSSLGALFGALRGVLVLLVLVLLAGLTGLPQQTFWRSAGLSRPMEHMALQAKSWLPDNVAQKIHYQN